MAEQYIGGVVVIVVLFFALVFINFLKVEGEEKDDDV